NACELEIHALANAFYDLERFGLRFVASPRHADVLTVTGPMTRNMREALLRAHNAMPDPKWVVAIGGCAADGGIFKGSYACMGGVAQVVPVDLHIPGCPPSPTALLKGLLALLQHVGGKRRYWTNLRAYRDNVAVMVDAMVTNDWRLQPDSSGATPRQRRRWPAPSKGRPARRLRLQSEHAANSSSPSPSGQEYRRHTPPRCHQ